VWISDFSNDIVNAVKIVFGDTLPIEVCALQNNGIEYKYNQEVTYISATLNEYRSIAEQINERKDIGLVVYNMSLDFWW
jgi:hypothetical protein